MMLGEGDDQALLGYPPFLRYIWGMEAIMKTATLYQDVQRLPVSLQQEVSNFVSFLLTKYPIQDARKPHTVCMKGTFTVMSDDFNAPLDDFKDYQ
jgi:hypothetical protein